MRLWEGIYFALNIPVLYFYCVPLFVSGRGEGEDFWLGAWGCAVPEQHGNWGEYCRVTGVGRRTIKCHSAVLVQSWHLTYIWRVNRLVSTSIYKNHLCIYGCHVLLHGSSDHRGFSAAAVKNAQNNKQWDLSHLPEREYSCTQNKKTHAWGATEGGMCLSHIPIQVRPNRGKW